MGRFPPALLLLAGLVHLLPLPGLLGSEVLSGMYGVAIADPNLEILMRHRALLFGLIALLLLAAVVRPSWRLVACAAGIASAGSFVVIAWWVGGYNGPVARVVVADLLVVAGLACAVLVEVRRSPAN